MKDKNVIIKKLLNNSLGRISNLSWQKNIGYTGLSVTDSFNSKFYPIFGSTEDGTGGAAKKPRPNDCAYRPNLKKWHFQGKI